MSERFDLHETRLKDLYLIDRKPLGDARGYLERLFCDNELEELLVERQINQINYTSTTKEGAVRGLHFQDHPHAETKIVACLQGEVFDVIVDLRKGSPTFLKWHGEILSEKKHRSLYIPEGFAHGFQALTHDCKMLYFHTHPYVAAAEVGLNAVDPALNITWPKPITERSPRDMNHPFLSANFEGLAL